MNVDIAERLAKRRREAGYSQENLAEKLGVSRQAVSKWERSESSPDTDNLIALAQLYGVSLDELLYVDESFKEDVEFEAADRAAERKVKEASDVPQESAAADVPDESGEEDDAPKKKVKIGFDGIHVNDGEDYVHVSWRDGVHVKESGKGDEVHVGWNGVHVKEGDRSWSEAYDENGDVVDWDDARVVINGEKFDSWRDAHDKYSHGHWGRPTGYTVNGERFDNLKDARAKYGDEVGKSIPVKKHYADRAWLKFPFPLLVIIAYILLGVFMNLWGIGLFIFFTIPLYYMIGHAISTKKLAPFFSALYPIATTAWFLWMAFVMNQPHPAWVIFLTIPLVEWFIHSIARANKRRKKEADIIDV